MSRPVSVFSRSFLVTMVWIAVAVAPARADDPKAKFADVLQAHFAAWTKDSADGKLTAERVNALVNNARIHGDEAAAVAALHLYFRGQKTPSPVEEGTLLAIPKASDQEEERRDQLKKPVNLEKVFSRYCRHLSAAPQGLFENDAPKREGMSQGKLGDCFVIAPVGMLATHHPGRLKEMIEQQADRTYIVKFPGEKPVKVGHLTDAQIVLGSTAGDQGLWLNVMEEAVAIDRRAHGTKKSDVAMDVISSGGVTARTIQLLSGHATETIHLHPTAAKDKEKAQADALKVLHAVHKDKILACLGTHSKEGLPKGIVSGHAYGVIDFDSGKQQVTIWNPWGNHFVPKGESGLTNGYSTEHGVFTMPLSDFFVVFGGLAHQTNKPAPKN